MIAKIALVTVFLIGANCFYLKQEFNRPTVSYVLKDFYWKEPFKYDQPVHVRERRQVHGVVNRNLPANIMAKLPLAGNDRKILSAIDGLDGVKSGIGFGAGSAGLILDNIKKAGVSLGVAHTSPWQKTDFSGMADLSLYVDNILSKSFGTGASKAVPPFIPSRSWQPTL